MSSQVVKDLLETCSAYERGVEWGIFSPMEALNSIDRARRKTGAPSMTEEHRRAMLTHLNKSSIIKSDYSPLTES